MLQIPDSFAEAVVRVFEMLRDVPDRLLRRRGTVVISRRWNGVEGRGETAAEDVGEALEGQHDAVAGLARGGQLGRECRGKREGEDDQGATTHVISGCGGSVEVLARVGGLALSCAPTRSPA